VPIRISLHRLDGTLCQVGKGKRDAEMSVPIGYKRWFNFITMDRMVAGSTSACLKQCALELGSKPASGGRYKPTKGNVGLTLSILLRWSRQRPTAVWRVY